MPFTEICEGAGVDINWFHKFKRGSIEDPGIKKVQAVHDFLAKGKRATAQGDVSSSNGHAA